MSEPTLRAEELATCAWCPRLCRHVCPVAVGSARESAVPSNMALHPLRYLRGDGSLELARRAAALCVDCGACTAHCDLDQPLGALLARFRGAHSAPPPAQPLAPVEGPGELIAVESDDRRWAEALSARLGVPVARLRTGDHLGAAHLAHPLAGPEHAAALRAAVGGRALVVSEHHSLDAARAAGVAVRHLADLVPVATGGLVHHPCRGPRLPGVTAPDALACCGATAALPHEHPQLAADVARQAARRLAEAASARATCTPDSACAAALRAGGLDLRDPIDAVLSEER